MADEPTDLVLEHLKRIQVELSRVREDQRSHAAELSAVRQILGAHTTLLNQIIEDGVALRGRVDRIERRLDLVEPAE